MLETVISKPIYRVLADLTQQSRMEVALPLAVKELVSLKLAEADGHCQVFEDRYGMNFESFRTSWSDGRISKPHSYEVERDYWEWEAAVTDQQKLAQMLDSLA